MYKLFLSLRFLKSRIISYVAVGFTGIGVGILVVVLCVMGGFEQEFHRTIRGFESDITIESEVYYALRSGEEIMETVEALPEVVAASPNIEAPIMLTGITHDYGFLRGIDPEKESRVSQIDRYILSPRKIVRDVILRPEFGEDPDFEEAWKEVWMKRSDETDFQKLIDEKRTDLPAIFLGIELFKKFRLMPYDKIAIFAPSAKDIEEGIKAVDQEFEVVAAFETGNYKVDTRFAYALIDVVQEFIEVEGDQLSGIAVKCKEGADIDAVKAKILPIRDEYPSERLVVRTWKERDQQLLQAVRLEKWLITAIIFFLLILVSAIIVAILTMSVIEKTRDIGVLRALGGTGRGIMTIFLSQGLLIALVGAAWGMGAGLLFVGYVNEIAALIKMVTGYHPFPKEVYYLDSIPARVNMGELGVLVSVVLVISFALSLFPAWKAVRINTLTALRYE